MVVSTSTTLRKGHEMKPPNISKNAAGYNTKMFKSDRAVKNAFKRIGYGISNRNIKAPASTVKQFQKDYNKCADRFGHWGQIDVTAKLDKPTLNGLEIAVRWSVKRENRDGVPAARSWQGLCRNLSGLACHDDRSADLSKSRVYSASEGGPQIDETPKNFIEVLSNGVGKLRNMHNDHALRANILDFEKHGPVIFAVAILPPQADLPKGRKDPIKCPCVYRG